MNCKNLYIFFTFIIFAFMVLSSPIIGGENSIVEITDSEISNGESSSEEHSIHSKFNKHPKDINKKLIKQPNLGKPKSIETPNLGKPKNIKPPHLGIPKKIEESKITEIPDVTETPDITDIPEVTDTSEEICDTPECQRKAKSILYSINENVEPCDDFYEYVCGNLEKNEEIQNVTMNDKLFENMKILGREIENGYKVNGNLTLEEQKYDEINFDKVADFYHTCMDIESINAKGFQPILNLFEQLNMEEKVENLTDFLATLDNYDVDLFFGVSVFANNMNPDVYGMYINQPSIGLISSINYKNDDYVIFYKNIMKYVFSEFYKNQQDKNIEKMIESVLEFEKKLINITVTNKNKYYDYTIKNLNDTFPFMDWKAYFTKRYENLGILENPINDDTVISITTPSYFENLTNILTNTDNETLIVYAKWNFAKIYSIYFGSDILKVFDIYNKTFNALYYYVNYSDETREKLCTALFSRFLMMSSSKIFVDANFEAENINIIKSLSENIQEAMNKRISEVPWLDEETRKNAIKKSSEINFKIGYPEFIMKPKELYKYYEDLEINSEDFFTNIISNILFENKKKFNKFEKPYDEDDWGNAPFLHNAFYYYDTNSILLLAGYFQDPDYSPSYPNYINYGSVGFVIGHEITHAFDNEGSQYDYRGSLNNWWTNSTKEEFGNYSQCFVDQYSKYNVTDSKGNVYNVNGNSTIKENIADNGGISNSYDAWKLSLMNDSNAKEKNKNLPGLSKFTHDQLFFISYGQMLCEKMNEENITHNMEKESYPISKFRVLGSLTNNDNFAKAFNCQPGSPMNPENKCKIW